MRSRTVCMECFETSMPDTLLEGSDALEMMFWLCLVLPGWLYCAWRHALRRKVCRSCGGESLMREARAAAARWNPGADPGFAAEIRSERGAVLWPRPLVAPRTRLRKGFLGAALGAAALLGWIIAVSGQAPFAMLVAQAATLLAATWLVAAAGRVLHQHITARACRAWALDGRTLRIEML